MKKGKKFRVSKDRWKGTRRRLSNLKKKQIDVGFFEDSQYSSEQQRGTPYVAAVAAWQNEGVSAVHIPPRPFFTNVIDDADNVSKDSAKDIAAQVFEGGDVKMKPLGDAWVISLKEEIINYPPPNAPSTVARKGFDDPLIETGKMADSVRYREVSGEKGN